MKGSFVLKGKIRKCVAWKRVYSKKLGKTVKRCANYRKA